MDRKATSRLIKQLFQWILGSFLLFNSPLWAQPTSFAWEYSFGDASNQEANAIADDTLTNSYIHAGRFTGTLAIGDSTFVNPNGYNGWLAKSDYDGNLLWTLHFPSTTADRINDVVVDDQSNVYITGNYTGTTSFIGTLGTSYALTSQGNTDIFVVKFNADGEILWANSFGGAGEDVANAMAFGAGFIYVTGGFSGSFIFGNPPAVASAGGLDAFLLEINPASGVRVWLRQGACTGDAVGTAVDADASGVYFAGTYDIGSLDLDGFGPNLVNFGSGGANPFVASYAPTTGLPNWQNWMGSFAEADVVDLIIAPNGRVHLFGNLDGDLDFPGLFPNFTLDAIGLTDVWKATFDETNGNPINGHDHGGPGQDSVRDASVSTNGEFTWAINSDDSLFLDSDTVLANNNNLVVLRSNPIGFDLWTQQARGPNDQIIQAVTALRSEVALNGFFNDISTFPPFTSTHAGNNDLFISKLGCPSNRSPFLDTLAGANDTVCQVASVMADADTLSGFVGTWAPVVGTPTIANNNLYNTLIIPNGNTPFSLEWSLTQGSCTVRDTVEYFISTSLQANAGPDTSICDTFFTLQGNPPNPASGTWLVDNGSGVFANSNLFNTTVSGLSIGINTFIWILNDGVCIDRDTVNITVYDPNAAFAGVDTVACQANFQFYAADPSPRTGSWTEIGVPTATIATPGSFNSAVVLTPGTAIFQWEVTDGFCAVYDTISFTYAIPVPALAGNDTAICGNTFVLGGNNPTPSTGQWNPLPGPGVVTSPNSPNSGITGLVPGINSFEWVVTTANTCIVRDTIDLTTANLLAANAGIDSTICQGSAYTLNGNSPAPGAGEWTILSASATLADSSQPNSGIAFSNPDTLTLVWEITDAGCFSSDSLILVYDTLPVVDAGPNLSICADTISLNATDPTPFTGLWTTAIGSGNFSSLSDANALVSNLGYGLNQFTWTIDNGNCAASSSVFIATDTVVPAIAYPDTSFCGDSIQLSANAPFMTSGQWDPTTNNGTFGNLFFPFTYITNLDPGPNAVVWILTRGGCIDRDTIVINSFEDPSPALAGSDIMLCNDTFTTLAAIPPLIGNGSWNPLTGPGTLGNLALANSPLNGLQVGSATLEWRVENGPCPVSRDTVTVSVTNEIPALAGPDQNLCDTAGTTLTGSSPLPGAGEWVLVPGSTSISSAPITLYNALVNGDNLFAWTITDGPCVTSDTVNVNVTFSTSLTNAGPDVQLCGLQSTALLAVDPSPGTGLWTTSSTATAVNPVSPTSAVNTLSMGTSEMFWTVTEGNCTFLDTALIVVFPTPTPANAGIDQTLCDTFATTLNATDPLASNGNWTGQAGVSFNTASDSNATVTSMVPGSNLLVWTTTLGPCSDVDTVVIAIDVRTVLADAGLDFSICQGDSAFVNGSSPPAGASVLWTLPNGIGTLNNDLSATTFALGLPLGLQPVAYQLLENSCLSYDTVTVDVLAVPTADAGPDQLLCDTSSTQLNATSTAGIGIWSLVSGPGSVSNSSDSNATLNGLMIGNTVLVWTVDNGLCPVMDSLFIEVNTPPDSAVAGFDQEICEGTLTSLMGNTPVVGLGNWTSLNTGNIDSIHSGSTSVNGMIPGSNPFVWTISLPGCQDRTDTVVIDVVAAPVVNAGPDGEICQGDSVTLNALPFAGLMGFWTDLSNNAVFTLPDSNVTGVSNLLLGPNTLVLEVLSGPCAVQDTVLIEVDDLPTPANAGPNQTVFGFSTQLQGNTPMVGLGAWTATNSGALWSDESLPNSEVSNLSPGNNTLVWTISNGVCPASADSLLLEVLNLIVPSGFSPNGDGRNDSWVIRGIDAFGPAKVVVFNRWENVIFQSDDYQNDWLGTNANGSQLSDDTYFYLLNLDDGREFKGFVVIKR